MMNVKRLGQVFTPADIVNEMMSLINYGDSVLEPSCGDGAFYFPLKSKYNNVIGIEKDINVCPKECICQDFFDYKPQIKFKTIIGNPPYVKYNNILPDTLSLLDMELFDKRSNLCLFFIKRCIDMLDDNGELIFIVPREVLKNTSARKLNEYIYNTGTITYIRETGDTKIFAGACPNCIIFRYEKGNMSHVTDDGRYNICSGGQLIFKNNNNDVILLKELVTIKVGGVSGDDAIFANDEYGTDDFVCSYTRKTGKTKRMIYNKHIPYIDQYHDRLIGRKIRKYTESNWWMWGRDFYHSDDERIYVNCKTRNNNPFFTHECKNYDGSVLALFPKSKDIDTQKLTDVLNNIDWEELGFKCDGRYIFSQRSLENVPIEKKSSNFLEISGKIAIYNM